MPLPNSTREVVMV